MAEDVFAARIVVAPFFVAGRDFLVVDVFVVFEEPDWGNNAGKVEEDADGDPVPFFAASHGDVIERVLEGIICE